MPDMLKEYKPLNEESMTEKPVFGPTDPSDLTPEYRKMDLEAVNLIKEKWCEKIKGQTRANENKQNRHLKYV